MDTKMPDFSMKRWEEIVEAFYSKYKQLKKWQDDNYKFVCKHGYLTSFTGRTYHFKKYKDKYDAWVYSRPEVCNFIVQGSSTGDIVPLAIVIVHNKLKRLGITDKVKIIMQVHDSIVFDSPPEYKDIVCATALETFRKLPEYISEYWGVDYNVPMDGEAKYSENWYSMTKWKG
jgi:DNA polymerase-1